jgi:uncharacterized protein YjiS (DUF1127 family)
MTVQIETFRPTRWSLTGLFRHLRAKSDDLNAAHEARRAHMAVTDRDLKDVGLSRDEVVGVTSHQPELPFFMQYDFQAHRR